MGHIPTLSYAAIAVRLFVALVLSGAIGLEREMRERNAGLRTHIMVGIGATLFTLVSVYGVADVYRHGNGGVVSVDPTRIAAQIVSGIGFLGAGAIIRHGFSVKGLTTAATLWAVAAIGMATGAGYFPAAAMTTAAILIGLGPLRWVERQLIRRVRPESYTFTARIAAGAPTGSAVLAVERFGGRVLKVETSHEDSGIVLHLECELPPKTKASDVNDVLIALNGVAAVTWES